MSYGHGDYLPKHLKIDLISTSLAVAVLVTASFATLTLVPQLSTPVIAENALVTTPVVLPTVPTHVSLRSRILATPLAGVASWYGSVLEGHHTASGERFHKDSFTAAHRTLPFGTLVRVTDDNTGKSVVVRINDRGVLFADRVIDLSSGAAEELGILRSGIAKVHLNILKKQQPATDSTESQTTAPVL